MKITRIKTFLAYPWRKKIFVIELVGFLFLAKVSVRLLPFSILSKYLLHKKTQNLAKAPPLKYLQGISHFIALFQKHLPWNSVCLDQAIAVRWMLARKRVPTKLYFGVMKDPNDPNKVKAHAWLMVGDYCITGQGYEGYRIIHEYA